MSRLTRDGTGEPVSRDQILRHVRGHGNIHFPCSADHEQDWQLYPVDPYFAICDDHTYIHTYSAIVCDDPTYVHTCTLICSPQWVIHFLSFPADHLALNLAFGSDTLIMGPLSPN